MTYLPSRFDFDQRTLVEIGTETAKKLRACTQAERAEATSAPVPTQAPAPADVANAEAPEPKVWTAQEIALATFWVAG